MPKTFQLLVVNPMTADLFKIKIIYTVVHKHNTDNCFNNILNRLLIQYRQLNQQTYRLSES